MQKVQILIKCLRQNITCIERLARSHWGIIFAKNNELFLETAITVPINPQSLLGDPTPLQTLLKGGSCVDGRSPSVPGDRTRQLLGGVEGKRKRMRWQNWAQAERGWRTCNWQCAGADSGELESNREGGPRPHVGSQALPGPKIGPQAQHYGDPCNPARFDFPLPCWTTDSWTGSRPVPCHPETWLNSQSFCVSHRWQTRKAAFPVNMPIASPHMVLLG